MVGEEHDVAVVQHPQEPENINGGFAEAGSKLQACRPRAGPHMQRAGRAQVSQDRSLLPKRTGRVHPQPTKQAGNIQTPGSFPRLPMGRAMVAGGAQTPAAAFKRLKSNHGIYFSAEKKKPISTSIRH